MSLRHEWSGFRAIFIREIIRYVRQKSRIVTSIFTPLLWLVVIGSGIGTVAQLSGGVSYQQFIFPGIIGMAVLFNSIFFGISVIYEKQFGFLKEMLVAPISRVTIFLGKSVGGAVSSVIQGLIIICLGLLFNIHYTPASILLVVAVILLLSISLVSIGLIIGLMMDSNEGFNLIMSFLVIPLWLTSGALFPINQAPQWLQIVSSVNPVTYAVDAMRHALLGQSAFGYFSDFAVLSIFMLAMLGVGSWLYSRKA
ncbi:TPA: ABC transporter permease [Candidatus Micrarchaeota archaeon]|nr:ABC transporter permease [Candidatus Micrarchaeota archaeon]